MQERTKLFYDTLRRGTLKKVKTNRNKTKPSNSWKFNAQLNTNCPMVRITGPLINIQHHYTTKWFHSIPYQTLTRKSSFLEIYQHKLDKQTTTNPTELYYGFFSSRTTKHLTYEQSRLIQHSPRWSLGNEWQFSSASEKRKRLHLAQVVKGSPMTSHLWRD